MLKCKHCKTRIVFDINERKRSFSVCPNCANRFFDSDVKLLDDFDDVMYRLKHIKELEISFICDKKDNNER